MEIKEVTEENKISVIKPEARSLGAAETRNYRLQEQRTMKKKLDATEREEVAITTTGGGVRIRLNTGAYELLKISAERFYSLENNQFRYQRVPVTDKKGNHVETKYKVSCGKSPFYTLNMYHTKSSCLVNGKQADQFMDCDFPQLIQGIESTLGDGNISIQDVNSQLRSLLLQYKNNSDSDTVTADARETDAPKSLSNNENADFNHTVELVSEHSDPHENSSGSGCCSNNDSNHDKYMGLLESIAESVMILRTTLENHIQATDRNFCQIRDEMQSVKRQMQCGNEHNISHFDEINIVANDIRQTVGRNYDALTRRLQQISDLVKNLPVKSQAADSDKRPVEPESIETKSSTADSPTRERTLIIGDSILKGIQPPGLANNVELTKVGGAKVKDLMERLSESDMCNYSDVIIHVGGNDVSDGKLHQTSRRELLNVTQKLQTQRCKVHLCTVCPRQDADVTQFNNGVRQICRETGAGLIDCYQQFINGNGDPVKPYFASDGIHLNMFGSRTFVATVNSHIPIIRNKNVGRQRANQNSLWNNRIHSQRPKWGQFPRGNRQNFFAGNGQSRRYSH